MNRHAGGQSNVRLVLYCAGQIILGMQHNYAAIAQSFDFAGGGHGGMRFVQGNVRQRQARVLEDHR